MLVAPEGDLRVVASSSEAMRVVELFELQADEGPCSDCYRRGERSTTRTWPPARDPGSAPWPWAPASTPCTPCPCGCGRTAIGALNLFGFEPRSLTAEDVVAAQALAAVATIAILQQRVVADARLLNDQLNHALTARVVIEQAKGVLAERAGLSMESAFEAMRQHARDHNLHLADVARSVVDKTLGAQVLAALPRRPPPRTGRPGSA